MNYPTGSFIADNWSVTSFLVLTNYYQRFPLSECENRMSKNVVELPQLS